MAEEDSDGNETTFTRAQMAKMVNAQVREKVAAELAKYGDLDELKAKAAEADKQKTQLEKIEEQLAKQIKRAEDADERTTRREVADELGLTVAQVGRLRGKTREELLADGREYISENGIKTKTKGDADQRGEGDRGEASNDEGNNDRSSTGRERDTSGENDTASRERPARAGRPRERLRSGGQVPEGRDSDTDDPRKLAAMVPRY